MFVVKASRQKGGSRMLAVGATVAFMATATLSVAFGSVVFAAPGDSCTEGKDYRLSDGKTFPRGTCTTRAGAPLYAEAKESSRKVSTVRSTRTSFVCGVRDDDGNGWLYTYGHDTEGGLPAAWGWMPAEYVTQSKNGSTPGVTDCSAPNGSKKAKSKVANDVWDKLAQCESGGNYAINTGNGYYGGFQFSSSTWKSVGGPGMPHEQPPEVQKEYAQKLQERSGWGQWPACSRKLGL